MGDYIYTRTFMYIQVVLIYVLLVIYDIYSRC